MRSSKCWIVVLVAGAAAMGGCSRAPGPVAQAAGGAAGRPTPAPLFAGDPETVGWSDIRQYLDSLTFDTSPAASDAQYLLVRGRGGLSIGPYAAVAPEIGIHLLTPAMLQRGRIIARYVSTGAYAPLGIPAETSYVWAQGHPTGRFLVIPNNLSSPIIEKAMVVSTHTMGTGASAGQQLVNCTGPEALFKAQTAGESTNECYCCGNNGWCERTDTTRSFRLSGGTRELIERYIQGAPTGGNPGDPPRVRPVR